MQSKVIIFSFSEIAEEIAKVLKTKDYYIIIIEEDENLRQQALDCGYDVKDISLMEDKNLLQLGINDESLKAFFCVSDNKNINLFVTLSVRNLNKDLKIISVSSNSIDNKTMHLAGADKIINPYEIGALKIFRLLHKPFILNVLDDILFNKTDIKVSELIIEEGSKFDGLYLKDIDIAQQYDIIVLGLQDKELGDKFIFYSSGINHKIDVGDTLVVLGLVSNLERFYNDL